MKKIMKIAAAAVTAIAAVSFAGCSCSSCSGCSSSAAANTVATTANWNVRTSSANESSFYEYWKSHKEICEYSVAFTEGSNSTYYVQYDGVTYSTEFYMLSSEWNYNAAEVPEELRSEETSSVYVYKTSLTAKGKYVLTSSGTGTPFSDSTETICYFRPAGDNLIPVYSKQIVNNTSPNTLSATSEESLCITLSETYETYYNADGTKAVILTPTGTGENTSVTVNLNDGNGYSVFDNSQLRAAMRLFTATSGSTYVFNALAPQNGSATTCQATCGDATALSSEDEEQAQIIAALDTAKSESGYVFLETSDEISYRYNEIELAIVAKLQGTTSTYWYSTVESNDINAARAVLLRMSTPLSFNLGTLTYTLKTLAVEKI